MSTAAPNTRSEPILERCLARVETSLRAAVDVALVGGTPPRLRDAIRHAVFAGGARLRPTLCVAVAEAYGDPNPGATNAAATSLELMHCASLVHDDLPCFDDATLRRGQPTVHAAYGVPTAVLAGDALIVMAFEVMAEQGSYGGVAVLAEATGPARGLIAGQAWEAESTVSLEDYHRAKTASLFQAAATLGARSAGEPGSAWGNFGDVVGRAYQAADDVVDAVGCAAVLGKSAGRDQALQRPSVVRSHGVVAARRRVDRLVADAGRAIPSCPGESSVRAWLARLGAKVAEAGAYSGGR